ncbi:MAG: MotA/TolQ/ExbB proton channel family protein [Thermodesulfovibrionales bacterium]|nr:MotA/TolQ/ExbB proton channel family protein [Thermodesulfovibrionales bacterium]
MNVVIFALSILIFIGLVLTIFKGISLTTLFNWEALVIIIGGTSAGLLIGYPIDKLKETFNAVINSFNAYYEREKTLENILTIARLYKKSEIRSIEKLSNCINDSFLRLGITLLINYHRYDDIKNIMEREMNKRLISLHTNQNILKTAARLAPSLGLAGTVISLIKMFGNMSSAESMMPLMAVALMSTFYGVVISNLIFLPLSAKLKDVADSIEEEMYLTIEGIIAIYEGEHPMKIEERLRGDLIYQNGGIEPLNNHKVRDLVRIGA